MTRGRPIACGHCGANPPGVYRAQKVVARLEKDVMQPGVRGGVVSSPAQLVSETLAPYMGDRATEMFLVLYVDVRNHVVGYDEYGSGSITGVEVTTSGILRGALLSGAPAIVTVHQHPSGDPTPSPDDRRLWRRIRDAAEIIGLVVLDNLIVTADRGRFFSESEESP